ncbi:MAG TPA: hypothetical protein VG370_29215 [Chloroflexota bacterium]|nr:hypothetical protein [Chloroflexota bacterium]
MKRTISALILAALVTFPTASTALADDVPGDDVVAVKAAQIESEEVNLDIAEAAAAIAGKVDRLDARIARIAATLQEIDGRLASALSADVRLRLEQARLRLEAKRLRLEQERQAVLELACGNAVLALLVPQCFLMG